MVTEQHVCYAAYGIIKYSFLMYMYCPLIQVFPLSLSLYRSL